MLLIPSVIRAILLLAAYATAQNVTMGRKVFAHYMVECIFKPLSR